MRMQTARKQGYFADPETIHLNLERVWQTLPSAAEAIGTTLRTLYNNINAGRLSASVELGIRKCGVDPAEIVKPIQRPEK